MTDHVRRIHRHDPGYEQRRLGVVWNEVVPDRRPDVIATPARRADVAALVREAGADGRRVAVKSGGHNWLGSALRDGGLLIDLGQLTSVEVDHERRVATVQPGATHAVLADAIVPHGLAFPIGHCPTVGLGGYLLAGGMGWNLRAWGPGCWNVLGADVVLADGSETFVDATSDPVFWALRGASAGFPAIATRFHVALQPLPEIRSRRLAFALQTLSQLVPWASDRLTAIGPGAEISLIARPADPADGRPGLANVVTTAFADDDARARAVLDRVLDDLVARLEPVEDSGVFPVALNDLAGEGGWEKGLRYAVDTCWLSRDYAEVGRGVARAVADAPSPLSRTVLAFGYMPDQDPDVAFTRFGDLTVNAYATWADPADDDANVAWLRSHMQPLEPLADGHYIGETDLSADPGRLRSAYPAAKWSRLLAIARERDPQGRFHSFLGEE